MELSSRRREALEFIRDEVKRRGEVNWGVSSFLETNGFSTSLFSDGLAYLGVKTAEFKQKALTGEYDNGFTPNPTAREKRTYTKKVKTEPKMMTLHVPEDMPQVSPQIMVAFMNMDQLKEMMR